ncbi:MAG: BNR-4 repeat-containing protein [Planctomycetota bacterium]|nr:MAG: BNR-4 repeat-containing protein [Planctomycetota bacterium]
MIRKAAIYSLVIVSTTLAETTTSPAWAPAPIPCVKGQGYIGLWRAGSDPINNYCGAIATADNSNLPMAYYAEKVNKTFFVFGGIPKDGPETKNRPAALAMISYYDHNTGTVPRPTALPINKTGQLYENPTLTLDNQGYIWIFLGNNGKHNPGCILKSNKPFDIDSFTLVKQDNFSNPQPWFLDNKGLLLIYNRAEDKRRQLFYTTSQDGHNFSKPQLLADIGKRQDALSWQHKNKIAVAFNVYADDKSPTNLYYMETSDFGKSWRNSRRQKIEMPLKTIDNPGLVYDYLSHKWLIHLKDLNIDQFGYPTIVYIMGRTHPSNPKLNRNIWNTARWFGRDWEITGQIRSDNQLDSGCLHINKDRSWRLIAPTEAGPQPSAPGGEIAMWTSEDQGRSWFKHPMTKNSKFNHNYVRRPVNAHAEFDTFWCDGHPQKPSLSRIYFADQTGKVSVLPTRMIKDFEKPRPVAPASQKTTSTKPN